MLKLKAEVLTYYGKGGKLICSWRGCSISDIDMLSLDHINNDGKHDRVHVGCGGRDLYRRLRHSGYESKYEYQTLCYNHQMKKEIGRRRRLYK